MTTESGPKELTIRYGDYELTFRRAPFIKRILDIASIIEPPMGHNFPGYARFRGPNIDVSVGNLLFPVYLSLNGREPTDLCGLIEKRLTTERREGDTVVVNGPSHEAYDAMRTLTSQLSLELFSSRGRLYPYARG